ncbi:MAG TPA: hypothetical protein VNA19_07325 [Pyrinomonadaceae bacterium]|nr:hypothetical protein [Pyrinomonadaceae bacterium]
MKLTPQHLPFAKLADLAEGRARSAEQATARAHLDACTRCSAQLTQLEQVVSLMRADTSEAAPRETLARVVGLFRTRTTTGEKPSAVRRLLAALSFDSARLAPAFGVRSGQAASARQLLYSAGETDFDVRVAASGQAWVVSGQILGECAGGRVELQGAEGAAAADLNEQCEFTLPPVPTGTYTLRVRTADAEVELPALELGA